jgi:hypothetical protein
MMGSNVVLLPLTTAAAAWASQSHEPAAPHGRLAQRSSRVLYIHVGKCGGSSVWTWLRRASIDFDEVHLHRPGPFQERAYSHFIVWVRDPIDRFVSAFNYQKAVLQTNISGMRLGRSRVCNLSHACLSPERIEDRVQQNFGVRNASGRMRQDTNIP